MFAARTNLLRVRQGRDHHRVTFVELFFDLVFVFAVTQLSHGLLNHLTLIGTLQTALLMMAMWWAWIDTAWTTNWIDPDRAQARLLLFGLMLVGLVFAASIPRAFEDRALTFALAYALMQLGRTSFMLWALKTHDPNNFRNFLRIFYWHLVQGSIWIVGSLLDGTARLTLWAIAVGIETFAPALNFWVPRLGRSHTADWAVEGGHMAERCGLFIIIALGESILITGATFSELPWRPMTVAAFSVSFVGSVAMWAVYFNIGAERATRQIATSDDPGRLARSGYTYFHIPMVAGIIVAAVADELVLHHPEGHGGQTDLATAGTIIGGPALYLVGNMIFKRLSAPYYPLSHLIGLAMLAMLAPATVVATPLVLSAGTTAVLMIVAIWEWRSLGRGTLAET